MRLDLNKGRWAELLDDLTEVPNGERRKATLAFEAADETGSNMARVFCLADELAKIMVTAWSFDLPIPRDDAASLDKIPGPDYDILSRAVTARQGELWPSFGPDGAADPESPTEPSDA